MKTNHVKGISLPGTYKVGIEGATDRAAEILGEDTGKYGLTTINSQEIREAVQTAGSVREGLMRRDSVVNYTGLSTESKSTLNETYNEISDKIDTIRRKKIMVLAEDLSNNNLKIQMAIGYMKEFGEEIPRIVEFAKKDFGVPTREIEEYGGGSSSIGTIDLPLVDSFYINSLAENMDNRNVSSMLRAYNETENHIMSQLRNLQA